LASISQATRRKAHLQTSGGPPTGPVQLYKSKLLLNRSEPIFNIVREVFIAAREAGLKIAVHAAEVHSTIPFSHRGSFFSFAKTILMRKFYCDTLKVKSDEEMDQILEFAPDRLGHALILTDSHKTKILKEVCYYPAIIRHASLAL
jgi:hypothetical protein